MRDLRDWEISGIWKPHISRYCFFWQWTPLYRAITSWNNSQNLIQTTSQTTISRSPTLHRFPCQLHYTSLSTPAVSRSCYGATFPDTVICWSKHIIYRLLASYIHTYTYWHGPRSFYFFWAAVGYYDITLQAYSPLETKNSSCSPSGYILYVTPSTKVSWSRNWGNLSHLSSPPHPLSNSHAVMAFEFVRNFLSIFIYPSFGLQSQDGWI